METIIPPQQWPGGTRTEQHLIQAKDNVVTFSHCYDALKRRLCGKSSLFPKHKRTLLVGKGPTFRLYAGALIERCFNAVLATQKGLMMPAEAMSFLFCGGSCKRQVQEATQSFPGLPVQFAMEHLWAWTDYAKIARATGRASGVLISSIGRGALVAGLLLPDVCGSARFAGTAFLPLSRLGTVFGRGCAVLDLAWISPRAIILLLLLFVCCCWCSAACVLLPPLPRCNYWTF